MSFERIGPYDLSRRDNVAAAIIISFLIGGRSVRLTALLFLVVGTAMVIWGVIWRTLFLGALGVWLLFWIYLIAPALRSRKRNRHIYLEYSPEGIVGETPQVRTTYKWSTIGSVRKVGSRVFIMITNRIALVVPDRASSPANIDRLVATCLEERQGLRQTR